MTKNKKVHKAGEKFEITEQKDIESVFIWFKQNVGQLFDEKEVVKIISEDTGIPEQDVSGAVSMLVKNVATPVVQSKDRTKVGIKEYEIFDGGYRFVKYKDEEGELVQTVCQHCNNKANYDSQCSEQLLSKDEEGIYDEAVINLYQHYADDHDIEPKEVSSTISSQSGIDLIPIAHKFMG